MKPFTNPSGETVYRVVGFAGGERIRQNKPSRGEAEALMAELLRKHGAGKRTRHIETHLEEAQVRTAEAFFHELPPGTDPRHVLRFYLEHFRPITSLPLLDEENGRRGAISAFCEWLETQRKNEVDTIDQRKGVLGHFAAESSITHSDRITIADAAAWIYADKLLPRTQRDRFDLLNQFCAFLVRKKYAPTNPVSELDRPVVKIDAPGVLTFNQVWQLLMAALTDPEGPHMLPFFAICCLSGVRPEEVWRLGADLPNGGRTDGWEDVYLSAEHRIIEVNKAKGGQRRRNAEICEPLWRILTWCKAQGLAVNYFSKRKFDRIRRTCGLFDIWEKDLCRHTYASHHYVLHKDTKALTAVMGNSEKVLFQHYIRPVPLADAIAFFGLILHWSSPRGKPLALARMERRLATPPAQLAENVIRVLIARLASELWRIRKAPTPHAIAPRMESYLDELRAELATRKKKTAAPN